MTTYLHKNTTHMLRECLEMGDSVGTPNPEPPFALTDLDKWVLSQTDKDFKKHNWEDLTRIVGE